MRLSTFRWLGLVLAMQVGCASLPSFTAMRKPISNPEAATLYLTAKQMENQGKLEKARTLYEELLAKQPDNPEFLHRQAVVCTRLQRYGEADHLYERARRLDPKNVTLLADKGYSCYLRGDLVEAEQILREATHRKPSDKRAATNLALVVGCQGNTDESLTLLRSVGNEANALVGLAYIHAQRGEFGQAEQQYRAALILDPNLKAASEALAELSHRKTLKGSVMAKSRSTELETVELTDAPFANSEFTALKPVRAVSQDFDQGVVAAKFVQETTDSSGLASLQSDDRGAGRTTVNSTSPEPIQAHDIGELIGDETSNQWPSQPHDGYLSSSEAWDSDSSSSNRVIDDHTPKLQRTADAIIDDAPISESQTNSPRTATTERLTFGPRQSRSTLPVAPKLEESKKDNSTPSNSDEWE